MWLSCFSLHFGFASKCNALFIMRIPSLILFVNIFCLSEARIWIPNYHDGSGNANLFPSAASVDRCSVVCKYPMDIGSGKFPSNSTLRFTIHSSFIMSNIEANICLVLCNLNGSRLTSDPVTPANFNQPLFNPYCWCIPLVMEYAPICIWCLETFNVLPAVKNVIANAYKLCVAPPVLQPPCPGKCGALTDQIQNTVLPCEKRARSPADAKACRCTENTLSKVEDCSWCLFGWDKNQSAEIKKPFDECNSSASSVEAVLVDDALSAALHLNTSSPASVVSATAYTYGVYVFRHTPTDEDLTLLPISTSSNPSSSTYTPTKITRIGKTVSHVTYGYGDLPWNLFAPYGEVSLPVRAVMATSTPSIQLEQQTTPTFATPTTILMSSARQSLDATIFQFYGIFSLLYGSILSISVFALVLIAFQYYFGWQKTLLLFSFSTLLILFCLL